MTPVSFLLEGTFLRSKRPAVLRTRYGELGLTATILDRSIGQCWEATHWQNHHRAESMPKARARGVEVECHPPGTCHLPLATMRSIPGVWRQCHQDAQPLSVRSKTKLYLTTVYATYAGPKQFGQTKAIGLSELFSPIVGSEDILDCAICVAFTFAIAE